jgi:formylglycine-generating enzyme required for sulfatase activity
MDRGHALRQKDTQGDTTERTGTASRRSHYVCPEGMVPIGHLYCVDVYEASLREVKGDGKEVAWSPFYPPEDGVKYRAVSLPGVYPQGYISGVQARAACEASGKRLCKPDEWKKACMGPQQTIYPYGNENQPKRCNDSGRSSMQFYNHISDDPKQAWRWGYNGNMMDPRLNQLEGTLARTGEFADCTNEYGVMDMVGNLHEWVDDPDGTFQGGYYLDTHLNADGCYYRTTAHAMSHSDYSTGFRCCADVESP